MKRNRMKIDGKLCLFLANIKFKMPSCFYTIHSVPRYSQRNVLCTNYPFRNSDCHPQIKICGPCSQKMNAFSIHSEIPNVSLFIQISDGASPKYETKHSVGYLHYTGAEPCFIYVSSYEETSDFQKWVVFITYAFEMVRLDLRKNRGSLIECENYRCFSNTELRGITHFFSSFAGLAEEKTTHFWKSINEFMPYIINRI